MVKVRLNLLKLFSGILSVLFYLGYNKNGISEHVIIMSTLHSDKYILKADLTFLVKQIIGIMCAKNSKIAFAFVKVTYSWMNVVFFRTRCRTFTVVLGSLAYDIFGLL